MSEQTWTVLEWGTVDSEIVGCTIVCVECGRSGGYCRMCDGQGVLHQPYQLPSGAPIDIARDAVELMAISARHNDVSEPDGGEAV